MEMNQAKAKYQASPLQMQHELEAVAVIAQSHKFKRSLRTYCCHEDDTALARTSDGYDHKICS